MDVVIATIGMGVLLELAVLLVSTACCCCLPCKRKRCAGGELCVWMSFFAGMLVLWTVGFAGLWHGLTDQRGRSSVWWRENGMEGDEKRWMPWTETWQAVDGVVLHVPKSEMELVWLLESRSLQRPVRVVGAGHSWSATSYTHGSIIDLRNLNAVYGLYINSAVDDMTNTGNSPLGIVIVQAGIRVQDLAVFLLRRGLCLYGVGSIREQSVGGVVSQGVHGPHPDGFNRHVVGLRVVLANGTVVDVTDAEGLYMWRASLGLLGVVMRVTLEVFPLLRLQIVNSPIPDLTALEADIIETYLMNNATFTGYLYPTRCSPYIGHKRVGYYSGVVTSPQDPTALDNQTAFGDRLLLYTMDHLSPAMQYMWTGFGAGITCAEQLLAGAGASVMLGDKAELLLPNDGLIPRFYTIVDIEVFIPLHSCALFAKELLAGYFGPVLIPVCLRLVRAERSCLSFTEHDACVFGVEVMRGIQETLDIAAMQSRAGELGGRGHFGKIDSHDFRAYNYECLPRIKILRQQLDPDNLFLTPYLARVLRMEPADGEFQATVKARRDSAERAALFRISAWAWTLLMIGSAMAWGYTVPKHRNTRRYVLLIKRTRFAGILMLGDSSINIGR